MRRAMVVDDDFVTVSMVGKILETAGYSVSAYTDPVAAADAFRPGDFDLVITDFHMPGLSGERLAALDRGADGRVPVIVLTSGVDVSAVVGLFKHGVNDYLLKPVVPEDLLHRVRSTTEEARLRQDIERIEEEKRLVELESRKIVNWRMLYAYKDITQTEQMINMLSRTINAAGGHAWLDFLKETPVEPDGGARIDKELLDLILASAGAQRGILEYLDFIGKIPRMPMDVRPVAASELFSDLTELFRGGLSELCLRHGRRPHAVIPPRRPGGRGLGRPRLASQDIPRAGGQRDQVFSAGQPHQPGAGPRDHGRAHPGRRYRRRIRRALPPGAHPQRAARAASQG